MRGAARPEVRVEQLERLCEAAKGAQWSADDLDWSCSVELDAPLAEDAYGFSAFAASPFAHRGRAEWDRFRWEFHVWLASQFLHGEGSALVAAQRIGEALPDAASKACLATQVVDETRHVEVFARYCRDKLPRAYPMSDALARLLRDVLAAQEWDLVVLGMQLIVEPVALGAFRLAEHTLHDPLIRQIARLVARDEARHVALGVALLAEIRADHTTAERARREDFVLDAIAQIDMRFRLGEIWERMDVDRAAGERWAVSAPLMKSYRQAIFGRLVSGLRRVELITTRVRGELLSRELVGSSALRAMERAR